MSVNQGSGVDLYGPWGAGAGDLGQVIAALAVQLEEIKRDELRGVLAKAVATANVVMSGLPVVDGYQTVQNDVVLLTAQTVPSQNGPWVVGTRGWSRPATFFSATTVTGGTVVVTAGATNAGTVWTLETTGAVTVDTTAQVWVSAAAAALGPALALKADDAAVLHKSGNETATGIKSVQSLRTATGPYVDVTHPTYGLDPSGVADCAAGLALAQAAGDELLWPAGTYRFASNVTITKASRFARGAKLKPASGVIITIQSGIQAPLHQIFDLSAGGFISFTGTKAPAEAWPEWWGAVGDAVADDTAACQACANAICGTPTGQTVAAKSPVSVFRLKAGARYRIVGAGATPALWINSVQGFKMRGDGRDVSYFYVDGTCDSGILLNGCVNGEFDGFTMIKTGSGTCTTMFDYTWNGTATAARSSSACSFHRISIRNGNWVNAWGIGATAGAANLQVDGSTWVDCVVGGQWTAGENTLWQRSWLFGTGTYGNNLDHVLLNSSGSLTRYIYDCNADSFWITGGQPGNCDTVLLYRGGATGISLKDVRVEGAMRLLDNVGNGAGYSVVDLVNITFVPNKLAADGYFIRNNGFSGTLSIRNVACTTAALPAGVVPKIWAQPAGSTNFLTVRVEGLSMPTPIASCFATGNPGLYVVVHDYSYTDPAGSGAITATTPGPWILKDTAVIWDTPAVIQPTRVRTNLGANLGTWALQSNATNEISLYLKKLTGQTANLIYCVDENGNPLYEVRSTGTAYVRGNAGAISGKFGVVSNAWVTFGSESSHLVTVKTGDVDRTRWETNGNVGLLGNYTGSYGGGVWVVAVPNATTAPTTNPTAAFLLYSAGGYLKTRAADGSVFDTTKAAPYTQTYATSTKTHAARSAVAVDATASTQTTPFGYASQAQADAIVTQLNNLRNDQLNTAQLLNALIDDYQAAGLAG